MSGQTYDRSVKFIKMTCCYIIWLHGTGRMFSTHLSAILTSQNLLIDHCTLMNGHWSNLSWLMLADLYHARVNLARVCHGYSYPTIDLTPSRQLIPASLAYILH